MNYEKNTYDILLDKVEKINEQNYQSIYDNIEERIIDAMCKNKKYIKINNYTNEYKEYNISYHLNDTINFIQDKLGKEFNVSTFDSIFATEYLEITWK